MFLKGIDTLELGLSFENYSLLIQPFLEKFKILKEKAQEEKQEFTITIGDLDLIVHASGQRFYAYRLSCNDFFISFMEKEMQSNPPITVKFLSSYLWSYGYKEAYKHFLQWFSNFNINDVKTTLTRVDTCLDTDEIKFVENDVKGVVTRAKGKSEYYNHEEYTFGRVFSGFTVGRGNPMLARIYDKTLEVKKSGKTWFHEIWLENGWNQDSKVWRIEFQLRRQVLKELNIIDFDSFVSKQNELWVYLTQKWLTIRNPSKDNVSRWKLKRKWKLIQESGCDYTATPLIRETIKQGNFARLLDQASGLLLSLAAIGNYETSEVTSRLLSNYCEMKLRHKKVSFQSEKIKRQNKFLSIQNQPH